VAVASLVEVNFVSDPVRILLVRAVAAVCRLCCSGRGVEVDPRASA